MHSSYIAGCSGIDDLGYKHRELEIMNFGYSGLLDVLIIAVVLLPVLGLLLWYLLGPRSGRAS